MGGGVSSATLRYALVNLDHINLLINSDHNGVLLNMKQKATVFRHISE